MLRKVVPALVVVVVLGGFWLFSRTRPMPVDVAMIARGPIRSVVEEEAKTRVRERYVVSAPVAGRLYRTQHDEGDPVEKGELVGEIDPLPLKSRVEEAEAMSRALERRIEGVATRKPKPEELQRAKVVEQRTQEALAISKKLLAEIKVEEADAAKDLERATTLARTRVIEIAELDEAKTRAGRARQRLLAQEVRVKISKLEIAMAKLDRGVIEARLHDFDWQEKEYKEQIAAVQAALAATRADLKRTRIQSPADGVILRVIRESEQVVTAGTPLIEIGDLGDLEVEVEFLSEDVAHMRVGMPAEIFGRALGDQLFAGKVSRIYPSAFTKISSLGVEQQRVVVVVRFDEKDTGLGDQYRIEARVILQSKQDVVLVPEGALFRSRGAWHVFRVDGNEARLTAIETGIRDGRMREVLSGLEPGAGVILHPDDDLEDGAPVEPIK